MTDVNTRYRELADYDRMLELTTYDWDGPGRAERLDAIAAGTAAALGVSAALINIVLDSAILVVGQSGLSGWMRDVCGMPLEWSFCPEVVLTAQPVLMEDTATDPRAVDHPAVHYEGIAAYAGYPLVSPLGRVLGSHCVLNATPRRFERGDIEVLRATSALIVEELAPSCA